MFDQCLFGYADGHRLLASSIKLSPDATSDLAAISDVAPGVSFGRSDGYWTGFPFPKLSHYVLMRTWPAPEMSRPGCVWTHAILIDPVQFEQILDLRSLKPLFRRPEYPLDIARYTVAIDELTETLPLTYAPDDTRDDIAIRIFDILYSNAGGTLGVFEPGQADDVIFRVWSQQWPRLRRNFRFRTAASRGVSATPIIRFDLQVALGGIIDVAPELAGWVRASTGDLYSPPPTKLRKFIWLYGEDVKRQRGSFRPLVQTFLCNEYDSADSSFDPSGVFDAFPEPGDARRLKQDLIDGLILKNRHLQTLEFIIERGLQHQTPTLSSIGLERLRALGGRRLKELVALAELSTSNPGPVAEAVLASVSKVVSDEKFWMITRDSPALRARMIRERPSLMEAPGATEMSGDAFLELFELIPPEASDVDGMIAIWMSLDDDKVASAVTQRFPAPTAAALIGRLDDGIEIARSWLQTLRENTDYVIPMLSEGRVRTLSTLLVLAATMGWVSESVLKAGTDPWIKALERARNDLSQDQSQILNAFLLALAMSSGDAGAPSLMHRCFEPIHRQLVEDWLPWSADEILKPYLPSVGWGRNWDLAYRLRLAIAFAFIVHDLPPQSFALLSGDKKLRKLLAEAAARFDGGKRYEKAARK